ncbi:HAUS augmin-like complex subunit 2 isoform X2 [Stigmatopora argus]
MAEICADCPFVMTSDSPPSQCELKDEGEPAHSSGGAVFSPGFYEAERRIRMRKELIELELETELLRQEKMDADVTHPRRLATRLAALQSFCAHLRDLLEAQELLAGQLQRPASHENLPVPPQLRSYVIEAVHLAKDFVETLDEKRNAVLKSGHVAQDLDQLDESATRLTAQSREVVNLAKRLHQWNFNDSASF